MNSSNNIHQHIVEKLDYFYQTNRIPHIIFHGSSGSGKRTIVDNFVLKIYQSDKKKIKTNVMFVNCAHGKGIKFIREELKFFAKTNIHLCSNAPVSAAAAGAAQPPQTGVMFKTIILLNADFLTIDAQSALRRCIELFSYNTRFFIIVENKQKLLNPILSRFCEIYVPDANLHKKTIERNYTIESHGYAAIDRVLSPILRGGDRTANHADLARIASEFYENGLSCLDIIEWVERLDTNYAFIASATCICYDKIKSEYRSEKLLMLYILDFLFLRQDKQVKNISTI